MKTTHYNLFRFSSFRYIVPAVLLLIVLIVAGAIASKTGSGTSAGKVKIVAAENFWGDIASQLGGDHVQVTSIITDPTADPHLYESSAKNAAAVGAADLVITNGMGYDDFMDKLASASRNDHRVIISAQKVVNAADGDNPHLWYDVSKVKQVAAQVETSLAAKDPANEADYQRNLEKFNQSLQPLTDAISKIRADYPDAPVAYTEPVAGYLLATAGLSARTPEGFAKAIEDGEEPSPADTAAMNALMTNHGVKVLLYNSQATSPVTQKVQELAKASGVPIVGVSETIPTGQTSFQAWQLDQINALAAALGGK